MEFVDGLVSHVVEELVQVKTSRRVSLNKQIVDTMIDVAIPQTQVKIVEEQMQQRIMVQSVEAPMSQHVTDVVERTTEQILNIPRPQSVKLVVARATWSIL